MSFSELPSAGLPPSSPLHIEIKAPWTLRWMHTFTPSLCVRCADPVTLSPTPAARTAQRWRAPCPSCFPPQQPDLEAQPFQLSSPHGHLACAQHSWLQNQAWRQSSPPRQVFRRAAATAELSWDFPAASSDTVSLFAELKLLKVGKDKLAANPEGLHISSKHLPNTDSK